MPAGTIVDVKFRNERVESNRLVGGWDWGDDGACYDIIAYRVSEVTQKAPSEIDALREQLEMANAETERLTRALRYEQHLGERIGTHGPGCEMWGPAHYECAMREIERMKAAQPSPTSEGFSACDMATAAAQGFRDGEAAAKREWVGLTDEEVAIAWLVADGEHNASAVVKRRITGAIAAKLREKNKVKS